MIVDNWETIIYTFQFIVPGYIISEVINSIKPGKKGTESEKIIQAIAYSMLNTGIWYWLFKLLQQYLLCEPVWYWLFNSLCVIITGGITGIVLGIIRSKEVIQGLLEHVHVNYIHSEPMAWDYKFMDKKSQWVEVTVANGKVIRGLYSCHSMTSSESSYRDMYIEQLYKKHSEGWKKVERTNGVWINPDEIRYIKFYDLEEKDNGQ